MRQHKFQLPILSDSEQHTSGIALDRHSMASSPPEAPENRDIVDIVDGLPTPLSHHTPAHSNLPVSEQRKQNKIKQNKTNMYIYTYIIFFFFHGNSWIQNFIQVCHYFHHWFVGQGSNLFFCKT